MIMRIAIVESGGKQYRAVEGSTIDVDRLAHEVGKKFDFERVLLMTEDDVFMVGTPTVSDIVVSATVVDHIKGPKVISFKYRPKKRIRVKGGHRHFYTRLMIDFIGKAGEERKAEKKEAPAKVEKAEVTEEPKVEKQAKAAKEADKKPAKKAPATKSTATKSAPKKTDSKKK
ncbi:MAG: 50S ribosomal protein L21 [Anaerolineales bacterium]|nr:50S ribosomal protein L21 [Anaerolineales bacterium]